MGASFLLLVKQPDDLRSRHFDGQEVLVPTLPQDAAVSVGRFPHACRIVHTAGDRLDSGVFLPLYKGGGRPAFHPRMMLKIIPYAMRLYSSRIICPTAGAFGAASQFSLFKLPGLDVVRFDDSHYDIINIGIFQHRVPYPELNVVRICQCQPFAKLKIAFNVVLPSFLDNP